MCPGRLIILEGKMFANDRRRAAFFEPIINERHHVIFPHAAIGQIARLAGRNQRGFVAVSLDEMADFLGGIATGKCAGEVGESGVAKLEGIKNGAGTARAFADIGLGAKTSREGEAVLGDRVRSGGSPAAAFSACNKKNQINRPKKAMKTQLMPNGFRVT
jgi:hypothetical protein